MMLKLGMDHQGLKINKVYINDEPGLTLTFFTAFLSKLLIVLQTNSNVSVYRTIGPLVYGIIPPPMKAISRNTSWGYMCLSGTFSCIS